MSTQRFVIDININGATGEQFDPNKKLVEPPKKELLQPQKNKDTKDAKNKKTIVPPKKEELKQRPEIRTPIQYFGELKAQYPSLIIADAVIKQTVGALIDYRQHTSGDAYANAQLDNGMKLIRYGAVIVGSGFNPVAIASIAGMEIISGISQAATYNYDRKLERQQISNMQAVAGNTSYGRNRGSV